MQNGHCQELVKFFMDVNSYPSIDQIKKRVRGILGHPNDTKAREAVGHPRYNKLINTVSADPITTITSSCQCPPQMVLPCDVVHYSFPLAPPVRLPKGWPMLAGWYWLQWHAWQPMM